MHGMRYTTIGGKRPFLRRLLWVLLVLAATCCFLYLFISRLQFFFTWPKSVIVDVTYSDKLEFPAVTVCNQNQFRLSKIYKHGLYDLFKKNYTTSTGIMSSSEKGSQQDDYEFVRIGCLNKNHAVNEMVVYEEVTLDGCQYMCGTGQYDLTCGVVLFLPLKRSCYLQPVLPLAENEAGCNVVEIYRRKRKENENFKMMCDFDGSHCDLIQQKFGVDELDFLVAIASAVSSSQVDHTTDTARGHILYLPETVLPFHNEAEMYTKYSKTDGKCVELFYIINGYGHAELTVSYRGEDFKSKRLVSTKGKTDSWTRLFARLPNGLNQVVIKGRKPRETYSGILLDSISIDDCKTLERDCMRFYRGQAYTGELTMPDCLNWTDSNKAWKLKFPDGHITQAGNKCRSPAGLTLKGFETPFCMTQGNKYVPCPIGYCECKPGYKKCGDGRCLPQSLICDGQADCPDLKDETDHCERQQATTCSFLDQYSCGYNGSAIIKGGIFWSWQLGASNVRPGANGNYLLADSDSEIDRIAYLISPPHNALKKPCIKFLYRVGENNGDQLNSLILKVTSIKDVLTGWRIWKNPPKKAVDRPMVQVPRKLRGNKVYFVFQGTVTSTSQMLAIANIRLYKNCQTSSTKCQNGQFQCGSLCLPKNKLCDGTSDCEDSSDETDTKCKSKTNINCDFRNSFICGYQTASTRETLLWSRDSVVRFPLNKPSSRKTSMGYECALPFNYNGTLETDCINDALRPGKQWCSLEKTYTPNVTQWDYCDKKNKATGSACGQLFTSFEGNIFSPEYPNDYPNNANCRYEVLLLKGMYMDVTFEIFDVKYPGCDQDFLLIAAEDVGKKKISLQDKFEWNYINASALIGKPVPDPQIQSYIKVCGKTSRQHTKFTTAGNRLRIYFLSDNSYTAKGFNIAYQGRNAPDDVNLIMAAGIRVDNEAEVNPESITVLVSPAVQIKKPSCLTFDYSVISDLTALVYPVNGSRPMTVWTMGEYTGNTWSRAWVDLPIGKYQIMWKHRYGSNVKIKATTNRNFVHTAAIDTIAVKNKACQITVKPAVDCTFESINQCGYMDKSKGTKYWSRIERGNAFYMVAKMSMDLQKVISPAVLQSRQTKLKSESCVAVQFIYLKNCTFSMAFIDGTGQNRTDFYGGSLNSPSDAIGQTKTVAKVLQPGTYIFQISGSGQCDLYIGDITIAAARKCRNPSINISGTINMETFEKWGLVSFVSEPLTQEYTESITYKQKHANQATNNTDAQNKGPAATSQLNSSLIIFPVFNLPNFSLGITTQPHIHNYSNDAEPKSVDGNYGPASFSNMSEFHWETGHQLDDFVYKCEWDGKPCDKSKLSMQVTDSGLCITFNGDPDDIYETGKIGSGFGLSLMLNCEQYEYIRSPNTDAGIKVYLHHPTELPLVKELGSAIYPGVHALVAAKYSKAEILGPPYGRCGSNSYKYFEDVKYTRPHCEMECITSFVEERCGCKMAHMPGEIPLCNLTTYLDCIIPLVYVEGLQNPNCIKSCKDACSLNTYSADISYAAFRSSSTSGILKGNATKEKVLGQQFLHAREIDARVNADQLEYTVERILAISDGIAVIRNTVKEKLEEQFTRMTNAMKVYVSFVDQDMVKLQNFLLPYTKSYEADMGLSHRMLWQGLDRLSHSCEYFISWNTFDGQIQEDLNHTMGADLRIAIAASRVMDQIFKVQGSKPVRSSKKGTVYKPATYVLPHDDSLCRDLQLASNLSSLQYALTLNRSIGESGIQSQCQNLLHAISIGKKCHNYYGDALKFLNLTLATNRRLLDRLKARMDLVYQHVRSSFAQENKNIKWNIAYYESMAKQYISFKITKVMLINKLNYAATTKLLADIDSIVSKLDDRAFGALKIKFSELQDGVKDVYANAIEAMTRLNPYFGEQWEDNARELKFWLTPVAVVNVPSLLRTTIPKSESWRVWPKSLSLFALNETRDAKLGFVVGTYIASLQDKLLELRKDLSDRVKVIKERETNLNKTFTDYQSKIAMREDFIMQNFIMMDVYFAVLKFESVQQFEAYGWLNFLSECGGYMGLLMGCSCLTICEVLDLILHHCFLKRLQTKQVGNSEPVKKPVPDDDPTGMTKVAWK